MAESENILPFDAAFDAAFTHLSSCRQAYEDDPRDPARYRRLANARVALDEARVQMNDERIRLGLEPRHVHIPDGPHVDSDGQEPWQGVHPN